MECKYRSGLVKRYPQMQSLCRSFSSLPLLLQYRFLCTSSSSTASSLQLYLAKQLYRLRIDVDLRNNNVFSPVHISIQNLVEFSVRTRVEHLEILVTMDHVKSFRLPRSLFYLQSIQVLRLHNCSMNFPSDFKGFNFLKTLELSFIRVVDCGGIDFFVSNCPKLKTIRISSLRYLKNFKITLSSSLETLYVSSLDGIEIFDCPKLQSLRCGGNLVKFSLRNLPSLTRADLLYAYPDKGTRPAEIVIRNWRRSIINISSHVQSLSLNTEIIGVMYAESYLGRREYTQILFKCLKGVYLLGKINSDLTLYALISFFRDCPSLETATISDELQNPNDGNWVSTYVVQKEPVAVNQDIDYVLYNLKTTRLEGFTGEPKEVDFVEHLLDTAACLGTFYLDSGWDIEHQKSLLMKLASLPRRSSSAKIILDGAVL